MGVRGKAPNGRGGARSGCSPGGEGAAVLLRVFSVLPPPLFFFSRSFHLPFRSPQSAEARPSAAFLQKC